MQAAKNAEPAERLCEASNADFSTHSAYAAVKDKRGDAGLRRDHRHRPQSTLHDGAVTATTPARA